MATSFCARNRSLLVLSRLAASAAIGLAGCDHENLPMNGTAAAANMQADGGRGAGQPLFPEPAEQKAITAIQEAGHTADAVGFGNMRFVETSAPGAKALKGLTGLETINIALKDVSDAEMSALEDLPPVHGLLVFSGQVTDKGLVHLKHLDDLNYLWIEQAKITGAGLENLKEMKELDALSLRFQPLAGGLKHLAGLTKLKTVNIPGTKITDADMEAFTALTQLESLNVAASPVTDKGLAHLKGLSGLKNLSLRKTEITDAGLESLKNLKNLEELDVLMCKGVTVKGVESLQTALPDCDIRQ